MQRALLLALLVSLVACAEEPDCDPPDASVISSPSILHVQGEQMYVVNSNDRKLFCNGYISIHNRFTGESQGAILATGKNQRNEKENDSFLADFTIDPKRQKLYLTEREDDNVLVFDLANGFDGAELIARVPGGFDPYRVRYFADIPINDVYFLSDEKVEALLASERKELRQQGLFAEADALRVQDLDLPERPRDVVAALNLGSNDITVLSADTYRPLDARRGEGGRAKGFQLVLRGSSRPTDMLFDDFTNLAYVVSRSAAAVELVDFATMSSVLAVGSIAGSGTFNARSAILGPGPVAGRNYLYFTVATPAALHIFDPVQLRTVSVVRLGEGPGSIALTPDNKLLIAEQLDQSIRVLDPITGETLTTTYLGEVPDYIEVAPANDFAYVTFFRIGRIGKYNLRTYELEFFE